MLIQNMQGLVPAAAPAPTGRAAPWCPASELLAVGMRPLVEVKPAVDPAAAPPPAGEVQVAVTQANRTMAALSAALMFEVDAETHTTVVKVVDTSRQPRAAADSVAGNAGHRPGARSPAGDAGPRPGLKARI
ncbi:MAG: flagellar protein FlaG [Betaproteobacteria bacterium]|nr:flagellar protein FlaG [Betaproteobacteria bacterium]